jgi:Tfp pilus assembly protein FimT
VSLSLAAVVSGLGLVQLPALVAALRVAGAAHDVASTLRLARGRALAAGVAVDVRFDAAARLVETRLRGGGVLESHRLPGGVGFAALPARARLGFTAVGGADNGTIVLAAGASARRVIVNQRGRVRVQ